MKNFSCYFILTFSILAISKTPLHATQTDSISINKILELVEKHSKEIKISQSKIELSEHLKKDAKSNVLPSLNIFAEVDKASNMPIYSNGLFNKPDQHDVIHTLYQSGANLYFNLYNGLKTHNEIQIAAINEKLSNELFKKTSASIKVKAIYLFYDLYLQRSWIEIMKADIAEKTKEAEEIKHLFQQGVILESDLIRAELEISKRKITLLEITNDVQIINQKLNVLIGNADNDEVIPIIDSTVEFENITLDQIIKDGTENAYDEKISRYEVEITERKVDLTKSSSRFKLGIVGSFQFSNPQIFLYPYNPSWYSLGIIGLKASYDISSIYHNKNKISAAKIEAHEAHIHHEKTQDDIRTKLFEAAHDFDEAKAYINIREQNVKYTKENERIIKNAYFSQTALITDLLDANLMDLKARFELKQAKINVFKTYYALKFAKGEL